MTGDNNFKWYWGRGSEPDSYFGPEDSRKAILRAAQEEADGRSFTIVEADKSVPTFSVFDAGRVLDDYTDQNEECWGEDGPELDSNLQKDNELEQLLAATFKGWMEKHGLIKTWSFGTTRNEEYFPETSPE